MITHNQPENSSEMLSSRKSFDQPESCPADASGNSAHTEQSVENTEHTQDAKSAWSTKIEEMMQLGDQFVKFAAGLVDLARLEASLALRSLPKVIALGLMMIPILTLTWVGFSALVSWGIYELSDILGLAFLTFFVLQVLLLVVCYKLIAKYRKHLGMSYTRAQITNFMRSNSNEFGNGSETKE